MCQVKTLSRGRGPGEGEPSHQNQPFRSLAPASRFRHCAILKTRPKRCIVTSGGGVGFAGMRLARVSGGIGHGDGFSRLLTSSPTGERSERGWRGSGGDFKSTAAGQDSSFGSHDAMSGGLTNYDDSTRRGDMRQSGNHLCEPTVQPVCTRNPFSPWSWPCLRP